MELTFPVKSAHQEVDFDGNLKLTIEAPIPVILEEIGASDIVNEVGIENILACIGIGEVIDYHKPEELLESISDDVIEAYTGRKLDSNEMQRELDKKDVVIDEANEKNKALSMESDEAYKELEVSYRKQQDSDDEIDELKRKLSKKNIEISDTKDRLEVAAEMETWMNVSEVDARVKAGIAINILAEVEPDELKAATMWAASVKSAVIGHEKTNEAYRKVRLEAEAKRKSDEEKEEVEEVEVEEEVEVVEVVEDHSKQIDYDDLMNNLDGPYGSKGQRNTENAERLNGDIKAMIKNEDAWRNKDQESTNEDVVEVKQPSFTTRRKRTVYASE